MKNYYSLCEKCDCNITKTETCVYCGKQIEKGCVCNCIEKQETLKKYISLANDMNIGEIEEININVSLGIEEILAIMKSTKTSSLLELVWIAYKTGTLMQQDFEKRIKKEAPHQPRKDACTRICAYK